jgi:transcriptional regulator with XRE-family HTH domain
VQDIRVGARFRALRQRLGWRQEDLAARIGISQHVVSLIERGRLEGVSLAKIRVVARELDADFPAHLRWRGGDLDRLLDEGHATTVDRVVALLSQEGWELRVEVSYSVYGERGSIDVLAWYVGARILLVVEVKTELVGIEETLRKHDEKARLAGPIAADQFGWRPGTVARLLVLPSLPTPRRRVARHSKVMLAAYPDRGPELRRWLANPTVRPVAGLLFLKLARSARVTGRKRIRRCGPT